MTSSKCWMMFGLLWITTILSGQWYGTNWAEGQWGKLPNEEADPFVSWYNRTTLNYQHSQWHFRATTELFLSPYEQRNYFRLSQLSAKYKSKKWQVQLGNFYNIIGRGTLLRAYEIPGAILEDKGFRSRNYFHRDILGVNALRKIGKWQVQLLAGSVVDNTLPPTFERSVRRTNDIISISTKYNPTKGPTLGLNTMVLKSGEHDIEYYGSATLSGKIGTNWGYYVESSVGLQDASQHAIYATITGYQDAWSWSLEFKKYKNFILGSAINEPPAGVRQQTYKTLNRSTHVINPINEMGYQVDLIYNIGERHTLNFNHAVAHNSFSSRNFTFQEYFLELSTVLEHFDQRFMVDYSRDPFKLESHRWTFGSYSDYTVNQNFSIQVESEYQSINRDDIPIYNAYLGIGFSLYSKYFFSMAFESTDDIFLLRSGENNRYYLGAFLKYKPSYRSGFNLFLGERRGGPACTAGICYEILDFRGVELRWTTRF